MNNVAVASLWDLSDLGKVAKALCSPRYRRKLSFADLKFHLLFYSINPFLPTGQFLAPKLIILPKCLIDNTLFFKVLFQCFFM